MAHRKLAVLSIAMALMASCAIAAPVLAQDANDAVARCDALAASPFDKTAPAGVGVPFDKVDAPAAIDACTKAVAARPNDARLRFQLGRALDTGERNSEARAAYQAAAEGGSVLAANNVGVMYRDGENVPQDDAKAVEFFRIGAAGGGSDAQNSLGSMYSSGRGGLPKDYAEAARLFKLASDQGNALATANLGELYMYDRGVPLDKAKAIELLQTAIGSGDPDGVMQGKRNLSWLFALENRDLDKAEALAREAVAASGSIASYKDTLAFVLYRKGEFDEALALQQTVVAERPGVVVYHMRLGDIFDALGRREDAKAEWRKVMAFTWPKDDEYGEFRRDVYEAKLAE